MPALTLPTFTVADVEAHNSAASCYVTIGTKVYDVTSFLEDHPGGSELILDHGGKDVEDIMKDELSHTHSEAAYEILDESLVGFIADEVVINGTVRSTKAAKSAQEPAQQTNGTPVYAATGVSNAEDLSKPTDPTVDYQTHKFLDLSKPLFLQVWNGGFDKWFYLEQVHRPRHYRGGPSAPLFGNFLEPLSKTAWWVIPSLWMPAVSWCTYQGAQGLGVVPLAGYWLFGLGFWTIIEYVLHRGLFHLDDHLPNNRVAITAHFLLHGIHHYLPMDKYRLVMPPVLLIALATPFWRFAHTVFFYDWYAGTTAFGGGLFGYICYDMTHYFLHHHKLPSFYQALKKYHLKHHFADYQNGFGVTSRFWDWVFGTELDMGVAKMVKTS